MSDMNVGDRVKLSAEGRRSISNEWGGGVDFLLPPDVRGTVMRPGRSRGGLRLRVLVDGAKRSGSYAAAYWEKIDRTEVHPPVPARP